MENKDVFEYNDMNNLFKTRDENKEMQRKEEEYLRKTVEYFGIEPLRQEQFDKKRMIRSAQRQEFDRKKEIAKRIAILVASGLLAVSSLTVGYKVLHNEEDSAIDKAPTNTEFSDPYNGFSAPEEAIQDGYSNEGFMLAYHEYCNANNLEEWKEDNFINFCSIQGYSYSIPENNNGRGI